MTTRFAQLRPGTRFDWRGRHYSKVSPLEGADLQSGERRLVPRSARVELVTDVAVATSSPGTASDLVGDGLETAVDACLSRLHRRMTEHLPPLDATQRATLDTLFREARVDLLGHLSREIGGRPVTPTRRTDDTEF